MNRRSLLAMVCLFLAGCTGQPDGTPVTFFVQQGPFVHTVAARGTVFSDGAAEVRCDVDGQDPQGTMILEILPEGTSVQTGDTLAQLDTSGLEEELLQQQIHCNDVEAEATAAENECEKAKLSMEEFLEGLYPGQKKAAENDILAAEEHLDRAKRVLEVAEGGTTSEENPAEDIDALRFNVEMAKRDLDGAKNRLSVLETHTKPLRLKQFSGEVKSAEAQMTAKKKELALQNDRLTRIRAQIAACTIKAPAPGVVFYANLPANPEGDEVFMGEGVSVRRRQVILRVARLDRLSVRIEVPEADIARLHPDMPALISVDTMPATPFDGHVSTVSPFPTRDTRSNTDRKRYEVHVAIEQPSGTLRPGLTAEVTITLAQENAVIQIPETSIFEEAGTQACLVRSGSQWRIRPVVSGPGDGKMRVIREGLQSGEEVAIHPLQYREQAMP